MKLSINRLPQAVVMHFHQSYETCLQLPSKVIFRPLNSCGIILSHKLAYGITEPVVGALFLVV
jgi:hypothetical protein